MIRTGIPTLFLFLIACIAAQAQEKLDYYDTLKIGGINQVVWVKGKAQAPLLLFLHGGPGSSRMAQADIFSNELQQHFTVVQWDQREAGKTLKLNATEGAISLAMMEQDTYELVKALLQKFKQEKLYLAGESWGTVPGFYMSGKYPGMLHAYLAFSPVIDQQKSEKMLIELLLQDAAKQGNLKEQQELASVKIPFERYEDLFYSRKWLFSYNGEAIADKDTNSVKQYLEGWTKTWLPAWNQATLRNLFTELPEIKCPVYFFIGEKDKQTNSSIAEAYYDQLIAPEKKLFRFKDAGHSLLVTENKEVQKIIIEKIMPGK